MKKQFAIFGFLLMSGVVSAFAQEKTEFKTEKHVQSKSSREDNSTLMMKIKSDEKAHELRRQELVDELRRLYKANFL